jgi:hypothetical protein
VCQAGSRGRGVELGMGVDVGLELEQEVQSMVVGWKGHGVVVWPRFVKLGLVN